MTSQCDILHPNHKAQYALNVKHKLTYMQGGTYTSLDEHAQAWLSSILCATQLIFFVYICFFEWQKKRAPVGHMHLAVRTINHVENLGNLVVMLRRITKS